MKPNDRRYTRRDLFKSAAFAGAAMLAPLPQASSLLAQTTRRSAIDQVTLGKTGIKLSRLGFGCGPMGGQPLAAMGVEAFTKLVQYAYDKGITYFDTAQAYRTFNMIGQVIKGLPREKIFIQSKIGGQPADVLAAIDAHRKMYNTDYIDSMLIHNQQTAGWATMDTWKRVMDGFEQAKEKKWIRAHGVSCHNLPALTSAADSDFNEVHLVRINPQGKYTDGPSGGGFSAAETFPIEPVMAQVKKMHEKGHGVIAMKLNGNGTFTTAEDRDKAMRFVVACKDIDAAVIGFTSTQQIDEAIERMNKALAEVG
jgi:aryl-alcohol dehydrogenase-like predicted oxidoreductase